MKFHVAWDSLEKENRNLKVFVVILLLLSIFLAVTVMSTVAQPPLVVERSCLSKTLDLFSENPTDDEMKTFVSEAIKARFNTLADDDDLLSPKQENFRAHEQAELQKQKMKQVVIVNSVSLSKEGAAIDADRLISVGDVRSTLRFPLTAKFDRTSRSKGNPYGLVLIEVTPIQEGGKK